MSKLDADMIINDYVGSELDKTIIKEIAFDNGNGYGEFADCIEYIISNVEYVDIEEYIEQFKITERLLDYWCLNGIDFRIYLFVREGILMGGHLYKYKEKNYGHFRAEIIDLHPTQQEIRVAKRIINFITRHKDIVSI